MPRNPDKRRCQVPGCRAWAVRGSDPPLCAPHTKGKVGAPVGNQNRRTHGFYSQYLHRDELADLVASAGEWSLEGEVAIARVALRRLMAYLARADELSPLDYTRVANVAFRGARTVARLMQEHYDLTQVTGTDELTQALNAALDSLSEEWGVELATGVQVQGDLLAIAQRQYGVEFVDVSDPA